MSEGECEGRMVENSWEKSSCKLSILLLELMKEKNNLDILAILKCIAKIATMSFLRLMTRIVLFT